MKIKIAILITALVFFISCNSGDFVPKPRGYNYIELPPVGYKKLDTEGLKYTFEYSKNATVSAFENEEEKQVIAYKELGAKIWLSYFPIHNSLDTLDELINTTYKLLQKHNTRADAIGHDTIKTESGKNATIFFLEGEVPSQYQFFFHDSTTNFLRGALYFETAQKNDSLAPIINYVKDDIHHLINTLEWRN